MSIVPPRTMPGLLELLPRDQVALQRMLDVIRDGYERFGFLPIQTPTMELAEVLLQKSGGETERQVYLAQSTGAAAQDRTPDLALRFDLTVPLARYVAEHEADLSFPFKRYQIQTVFRGEAPQRGRFREFYQCDIDVIGRDTLSLRYDAEIPAVIDRVFTDLAIGDFVISLNNRRLLRGLLHQLGVVDNQEAVLRQLDKLDKRDVDAVGVSLVEAGMNTDAAGRLLDLAARGVVHGDAALELLDSITPDNATLAEGLAELSEVIRLIGGLGVPADRYGVDISIARGLDYYTGTVYETTLSSHPDIGSICSGGRYDDLAGYYTTSRLPGVGISIGLSRLFWQLREAGLLTPTRSTVLVLVGLIDDQDLSVALQIATQLRQKGINTETTMESSKLARQLKYADRSGIRFLVLAGSNERARGEAMIRDLDQQTQHNAPIAGVASAISSMLERGAS